MPGADFFRAMNFYVAEHFLDAETCRRFREMMRKAPARSAQVFLEAATNLTVAENLRRTTRTEVPADLTSELMPGLERVREEAAKQFGVPLAEMQPVQFLIYRTGDFFIRHSDVDREGAIRRSVSVIIFLSSPGETTFTGGSLKFYGALAGRPAQFCLTPEEGMLVAFRSDIPHEVEAVTSGERFTAVTWFA